MATDNGVLILVPGHVIAKASQQLDAASTLSTGTQGKVTIDDVSDLGRVTFTFEVNEYRHGRSRFRHWRAVRADRA